MTRMDRGGRVENEDNNYYLNKWEIICGGITNNIKINIIKKQLQNKRIDKILTDINTSITSILSTLERLENPKFKFPLNTNNRTAEQNREYYRIDHIKSNIAKLEDLLNEKQILIKKKEEIL